MTADTSDLPVASLGRRLLALLYDSFLLGAIWFVTAGIFVLVYPLTGLPVQPNGVPPELYLHGILFPLLLVETWCFYAWFWLHGGQTLGMRAWRVQLRGYKNEPITLVQTLRRILTAVVSWALLGLGWWMALMPPRYTLHDRLSGTVPRVHPRARASR